MKRWFLSIGMLVLLSGFFACESNQADTLTAETALYTCPMPRDSVYSNEPGKCPKCGMKLVKNENRLTTGGKKAAERGYTCPMHPQVIRDEEGFCPICGMVLEKIKPAAEARAVSLDVLLQPVNQQVVANVPMVHMAAREEDVEMEAFGFVNYDTRHVGVVSSNVAGRIEKLYVRYRFQHIQKGQRIMDIYSPELLTAQENLLFLLKNDPANTVLINAARQKLLLLGMSGGQLNAVVRSGRPAYTVAVYSRYSGHIHQAGAGAMNTPEPQGMRDVSITTEPLGIKEGMYVQKGQNIFSVYNPARAWAVLNVFAGEAARLKVGNKVRIVPETAPEQDFRASIGYIEPVFRDGSKTVTARVYFDNSKMRIPIGSQVKATIFAGYRSANWLPEEAVLSLGLDKVVFVREGEGFRARKIETGMENKHLVQVVSGLQPNEAVAANAQYLVDSESFIKTNQSS